MKVSGEHHMPATLPLWENPLLPDEQEAGWALEPIWTF